MTVFGVSHPVEWTVVGPGDRLPSVLSWNSEDPLAVTVAFGDAACEVIWKFSRDLFADVIAGRSDGAGDGDVHVVRSANHGLGGPSMDQLLLTLTVRQTITLRADLEDVKFFLDCTFFYAPHGEEIVDIDTAITKLLEDERPSGV